jgi:hypothetical protein
MSTDREEREAHLARERECAQHLHDARGVCIYCGHRSTSLRRVTKPPMVMRSHRYPKKLYEAALAKCEEREEDISDVLREALERYVRRR